MEWERLEISSRKLEIPREHFLQRFGHNKGQKWYGPNRSRKYQEEVTEYTKQIYRKYLHDPDNQDGVNAKSSGP